MSEWAVDTIDIPTFGTLSPASSDPLADMLCNGGRDIGSSAAWTSANTALFLPMLLRQQVTAYQLGWRNGSVVTGNADAGLYDRNGVRLVSAGSTACTGSTNAIQLVDIADTVLAPGLYYLAFVMSSTSSTVGTATFNGAQTLRAMGVGQLGSALPLPSTATFVTATMTNIPNVFAAIEGATF